MKRFRTLIYVLAAAALLCGCTQQLDSEMTLLDKRITNLEERCSKLNENINALHKIAASFETYDFVKSVKPVYNTDGIVIAYNITFTNAGTVTIHNGVDADTPVIGLEKDRNGRYYWTVTYSDGIVNPLYLSNSGGQLVYASAVVPVIKIENGNWMISYDNSLTWSYLGKATGTSGNEFVQDVSVFDSFVQFSFIDGTTVNIPTQSGFEAFHTALDLCNYNLSSLKELIASLDSKLTAKDITPILSGTDTIGCQLILSDGKKLAFFNANSTTLPELSSMKDTDGNYYWAIRYPEDTEFSWVLNGTEKVKMNVNEVVSPRVGLQRDTTDNLYYWTISYDDGKTYDWLLSGSSKVAASTEHVSNPVTSLVESTSLYYIITVNGQAFYVPRYNSIGLTLDTYNVKMGASDTCLVSYFIEKVDEETDMLAISQGEGFSVWIQKRNLTRGDIYIVSPETFRKGDKSSVSFIVSDGRGSINTAVINITYGE